MWRITSRAQQYNTISDSSTSYHHCIDGMQLCISASCFDAIKYTRYIDLTVSSWMASSSLLSLNASTSQFLLID
jgi:hypothetical protein